MVYIYRGTLLSEAKKLNASLKTAFYLLKYHLILTILIQVISVDLNNLYILYALNLITINQTTKWCNCIQLAALLTTPRIHVI